MTRSTPITNHKLKFHKSLKICAMRMSGLWRMRMARAGRPRGSSSSRCSASPRAWAPVRPPAVAVLHRTRPHAASAADAGRIETRAHPDQRRHQLDQPPGQQASARWRQLDLRQRKLDRCAHQLQPLIGTGLEIIHQIGTRRGGMRSAAERQIQRHGIHRGRQEAQMHRRRGRTITSMPTTPSAIASIGGNVSSSARRYFPKIPGWDTLWRCVFW